MTEDWDSYLMNMDGKPASIFLDLALAARAPVANYPTMAYLRVAMLRPRIDGLSSPVEFNDLIALGNACVAQASAGGAAIFAGRNTSDGDRDYFFYVRDAGEFEERVRAAMTEFPAYRYEIGTRDDPAWTVYLEFLHPSPAELERMKERRTTEAAAR